MQCVENCWLNLLFPLLFVCVQIYMEMYYIWIWFIWSFENDTYGKVPLIYTVKSISLSYQRVEPGCMYSDSIKKWQKIFWKFPFFFFLCMRKSREGKFNIKYIHMYLYFWNFLVLFSDEFPRSLDKKTVLKISSVPFSLPYFYR